MGDAPRGIIAAGWVTSEEVYDAPHYDARRAAQGDTSGAFDVTISDEPVPARVGDDGRVERNS